LKATDWEVLYFNIKERTMALHHAAPKEVIDIHPLGDKLPHAVTRALFKTDELEVMRMVILAGKTVPEHSVPGEVTIQCIEGAIEVRTGDTIQLLRPSELIYLRGGEPHGLHALEDTSILRTIVLKPEE
jgi:quercetin dioxygenase-like cupin family protein